MVGKKSKAKYSKGSQEEVKKEMRRFKKGTAKSGRGGATVKNKKQAIAIALSKARKKGSTVPAKKTKTKSKTTTKKKVKTTAKKRPAKSKVSAKKKSKGKSAKKSKSLLNIFSW